MIIDILNPVNFWVGYLMGLGIGFTIGVFLTKDYYEWKTKNGKDQKGK